VQLDADLDSAAQPAISSDEPRTIADQASLPVLLSAVLTRYQRSVQEDRRDALTREAMAIAGANLELTAVLACAVLCSAACTDSGPARPYGPWAVSATLHMANCETNDTAHVEHVEVSSATTSASFLDWLATDNADIPTLLLAGDIDAPLLLELECCLPQFTIQVHHIDERTSLLAVAPRTSGDDETAAGASQRLFALPVNGRRPAAVRIITSRLWHAVATAVSTELGMDDFSAPITGDVHVADQAVLAALMSSAWPRLLPDVESSSLPLPNRLDSLEELEVLWLASLSAPGQLEAAYAVRSHAALVWSLAMITTRNPTAGYAGLLTCADEDTTYKCASAASDAGVQVIAPHVGDDAEYWQLDEDGARYVLRCPLGALPGVTVDIAAALAEQHRQTPFTSLTDIIKRVPAVLQPPDLLLRLTAAGACRDFLAASTAEAELATALGNTQVALACTDQGAFALPAPEDWLLALDRRWSPLRASPEAEGQEGPAPGTISHVSSSETRAVLIQDGRFVLAAEPGRTSTGVVLLAGEPDEASTETRTDSLGGKRGAVDSIVPVEAGGWHVGVSRHLIDSTPPFVAELIVELTGDRGADLARITAAHALLDEHPGPVTARLVLVHAAFKRVVERGPARGVAYTPALDAAAKQLLGEQSITLRLDVPMGSA
jgi:hypothetical protein